MEGNCDICFEPLTNQELSMECNHTSFHKECLEKHFKQECPICRTPHNYPVFGKEPQVFIPFSMEEYYTEEVVPRIVQIQLDSNYPPIQVFSITSARTLMGYYSSDYSSED